MSTITLTFGDQAENHVGMQVIGQLAKEGFTPTDFDKIYSRFYTTNDVEVHKLYKGVSNITDIDDILKKCADASIMIIRNGVNTILDGVGTVDDLLIEQQNLTPDKHYWDMRRSKVLNKRARFNLCFGDQGQEADFENGKGTIIELSKTPLTNHLRSKLPEYFGEKSQNLCVEGNYYYDVKKCGIGFHGDAERRIVIGIRLGEPMPLHYQWFQYSHPVGETLKYMINHGDIYVMSEKATGYDWKKRNRLTVRHAAGCEKYLKVPNK